MTTNAKAKKAAKPAKEPAPAAASREAKGKPVKAADKPLSPVAAMREVLAANPKATIEEIEAALIARGLKKSRLTISTIRSDFMGVYRALAKAGALKSPEVL